MNRPDTGQTAVYNVVSDDLAQRDYEDIDNPRPNHISLPSNLRNNDYNQPPNPHGVTYGYEIPLQVHIHFKILFVVTYTIIIS